MPIAEPAEELNIVDCVRAASRPGDLVVEVEILSGAALNALALIPQRYSDLDVLRDDTGVAFTGCASSCRNARNPELPTWRGCRPGWIGLPSKFW